MSSRERLSDIAIQRELSRLPGWSRRGDVLTKTFQFPAFLAGIAFVQRVARDAEAMDHHPRRGHPLHARDVRVEHPQRGGITALDLELAARIEQAAAG
jgi:4a-hydroxytetrahydrobiopterin dehydratase